MSVLATEREAYERARIAAESHCSGYEANGCSRFERRCADEHAECAGGTCGVRLAATE
jgi:hypothetical protein